MRQARAYSPGQCSIPHKVRRIGRDQLLQRQSHNMMHELDADVVIQVVQYCPPSVIASCEPPGLAMSWHPSFSRSFYDASFYWWLTVPSYPGTLRGRRGGRPLRADRATCCWPHTERISTISYIVAPEGLACHWWISSRLSVCSGPAFIQYNLPLALLHHEYPHTRLTPFLRRPYARTAGMVSLQLVLLPSNRPERRGPATSRDLPALQHFPHLD